LLAIIAMSTLCCKLELQLSHTGAKLALQGQAGALPGAPVQLDLDASSKLTCLHAMLRRTIAAGEKAVVVSTSTRMLDAAQTLCRHSGVAVGRIDGSTQPQLRQQQVDTFNSADSAIQVRVQPARLCSCDRGRWEARAVCVQIAPVTLVAACRCSCCPQEQAAQVST
jgi:SNF2 family DNA or RNA helicase